MSRTIHDTAIALLSLLALLLSACSGAEEGSADAIVARIDGETVRLSEVERRAGWRLHRARLDVHLIIEHETERLIEERLLERRARELGLDVESLLRDVMAETEPVTDADVERYLQQNPSEVSIAKARPRIRHYLEQTRKIERRLALLATLRDGADVEILVTPPRQPRIELDLRDAPSRGSEDAPVTVVHFADLSRQAGARVARDLALLEREFPEQIRVVVRSLPVARDELGLLTAQLAAAAHGRGLFWSLHDRLARSGGVAQSSDLEAIAQSLDLGDVMPGLAGDGDSLTSVRRDLEHAHEVGVRRAPTLFVNGRYLMGLDGYEALRELIEEELGATGFMSAGTPVR